MAIRARLAPPRHDRTDWPWHKAAAATLPASLLWSGDRRMEAESYLSSGFAVRTALERRAQWCRPFETYARVWQPSRLKGTIVSPAFGTPFLAATQAFDLRPVPRKWLSLDQIARPDELRVSPGTILVTRSGTVGRAIVAYAPHAGVLISDDLLRVETRNADDWGWLYAYLRCNSVREMLVAAQYGHVIKHLECAHLNTVPVPLPRADIAEHFNDGVRRVFEMRDEAHGLMAEAEERFAEVLGRPEIASSDGWFTTRTRGLFTGRRRLEAWYHNQAALSVERALRVKGRQVVPLSELTERIWWMSRFKRVFGEQGAPYLSAEELFALNPPITKRVLLEQAENAEDFFVRHRWLVMACSGQVYGLIGNVALIVEQHERAFLSHDLIRIIPREKRVRPGYLYCALNHPTLGRPLVTRLCYGTSIPHIEPGDLPALPIVRLSNDDEDNIADAIERAVQLRADADDLENALTEEAGGILQALTLGNTDQLQLCRR